jgi:hypothetical protein
LLGHSRQLAGRSHLVPPQSFGCSTRLLSRHGRHRRQTGEGITAPRRYGRDGRALRVQ